MSLEERARKATQQAARKFRRESEESRKRDEEFKKRVYDDLLKRVSKAFQEHVHRWAVGLDVRTPLLAEFEYTRNWEEPVHRASAVFEIDGIDFTALFYMRERPRDPYRDTPMYPMYKLYVYLQRDEKREHGIGSIESLGDALKRTRPRKQ